MLHAICTLAQRVDPTTDRGHPLANVQVQPFDNALIGFQGLT